MRYSESHKAETRERILKSAATRYRESGIDGASLPDIMRDAGLTVGGFYRHFDSKDDLFAATMDRSLEETLEIFDRSDDDCLGDAWAQSVAKVYLSMAHRANQAGGCPLPALAGDVARADGAVQSRSQSNLETLAETISRRMGGSDKNEAWAFLATLVGGLILSRMVEDDDLARSVLHACRDGAVACANPAGENATP